MQLIILIAL